MAFLVARSIVGEWLSLVEHLVRDQGVGGSNPLSPTNFPYAFMSIQYESNAAATHDAITISPGSRFRTAMMLAIVADALQIVVFPLFVEGALSPADDILDFGIAAMLVRLLGWHWEFLPSFLAKLVPGVDLVPFWTMAVANVYRKSKQMAVAAEGSRQPHPALKDSQRF
jgi:hypothetical protein